VVEGLQERELPGTGRLLRWLSLAHAVVGAAFYRRELAAIARDGVVAAVPYRGPKATAFWFLIPSPLLWMAARLIGEAEESGDADALRTVHRVGLASALVCVVCMPVSGFWGWLVLSLRGLREARRMSR
jgi:hypothetical protein